MEIVAERAGKYRVSRDLQRGLIKTELNGFWAIGDAEAFGPCVIKTATEITARHGRLSLIVDASGAPVQTSEVIDQSMSWSHLLESPGNRIAVIVSSTLGKLQLARRIKDKTDNIRFFESTQEAELWLLSDVAAID